MVGAFLSRMPEICLLCIAGVGAHSTQPQHSDPHSTNPYNFVSAQSVPNSLNAVQLQMGWPSVRQSGDQYTHRVNFVWSVGEAKLS